MKNRILTFATAATLLCLSTGCGTVRNFFFGRGASCGLCSGSPTCLPVPGNVPALRSQAPCNAPAEPTCAYPTQNACRCPDPVPNCGTCVPSAGSYGPTTLNYPYDPYGSVIGSSIDGTIIDGGIIGDPVIYGDGGNWQQRGTVTMPGVSSNYQSYKVDKDGMRIIHEDPLPPGAQVSGL